MSRLITLYRFTYPHEAALIQGKLKSLGIPSFVKDELSVQVTNFYSMSSGNIILQVHETDFMRANKILLDAGYQSNHMDTGIYKGLILFSSHLPFLAHFGPAGRLIGLLLYLALVLGIIGYVVFSLA